MRTRGQTVSDSRTALSCKADRNPKLMLSARTDLACVLLPIAVGNAMSQAIPYSDNQKKSLFVEAVRAANHMMLYCIPLFQTPALSSLPFRAPSFDMILRADARTGALSI